jgi:nucleoside-diphosphate-sugar epimerase
MSNALRLLVTGGSGFIGTNVIDFYLAKDIEVLNIDKEAPRNKHHQHLWKRVDILDMSSLEQTILAFSPTHVFHMAARTDLDEKNR